ncbi:PTS lactose/cellobiose transporter subunit IIA [Spiroplasma cantharicola]|uniref:PTS system, cellobiose-specific IIA component n=1 Tax=Spiroplasma cantharicola TaxID=362837 RepID=A0A0M4JIQ4_9MOLU|nr:PTS lactose/cellobiose transporter subunit IIA [Spiroplasma cantharicola]ALD66529.1 PTS system, cellobiose-specific IIA component [Spiroplasma cantharicola]
MEEKTIEISMELIGISGEAKGIAFLALKNAKSGCIVKAEELAIKAKSKLNEAHRLHAQIISREAQGESWDIKTLFIHSQDHFSNALVILELLDYIIDLYKGKK